MDWRTITNEREKFQAYLCSREWNEKREAVRERARNMCERCRLFPMDACHHLTYARKYDEAPEDLQAICNSCHDFTHGKSDFDPARDTALTLYFSKCRELGKLGAPLELFAKRVHALHFRDGIAEVLWAIDALQRDRDAMMTLEPILYTDDDLKQRFYNLHIVLHTFTRDLELSQNLPFLYADFYWYGLRERFTLKEYKDAADSAGVQLASYDKLSEENSPPGEDWREAALAGTPFEVEDF